MLDTLVVDLDRPAVVVVVEADVSVKVGQILDLDVSADVAVATDVVDVGGIVAGVL